MLSLTAPGELVRAKPAFLIEGVENDFCPYKRGCFFGQH